MSTIKPFRGLRPDPRKAAEVAALPYDVMSSEEARAMAEGNPFSFLHISKPEIDLDPGIDPHSDVVYATGRANLQRFEEEGILRRDEKPNLYLYRQKMRIGDRDHVQTGVVAGASVEEYERGLIKKHELTRADKELDRTRHVDTLNANTGPVFLTYAAVPTIDRLVAKACEEKPAYDFVADDGIAHTFWVVDREETIAALVSEFARLPHLYVADGHHRSAAGSIVGRRRREANPNHTGEEGYNCFLSVIFPHDQMYIMDYNRVVLDLNGHSEKTFLEKVSERFAIEPTDRPQPDAPTRFGMYLGGRWHRLTARPGTFDAANPVASLDVSILQANLLAPVLGIGDPRTDKRIDFVGGIRGAKELERRVREGAAVAFAMFPTSIEQLMSIADAGEIMPPKSTWFEPKLRSGMVVRVLD
jgi:uncharacterized protein (DUF1015 family)